MSWDADPRLFDEAELRKMFPSTPADRSPPWLGVAAQWLRDPEAWSWIGWRRWHCTMKSGVRYQPFEHGVLIGPLKMNPGCDDVGQVLTVVSSGRFGGAWKVDMSVGRPNWQIKAIGSTQP